MISGDTLGDAGEQRPVVSSMGVVCLMGAIAGSNGAILGPMMRAVMGSMVGAIVGSVMKAVVCLWGATAMVPTASKQWADKGCRQWSATVGA